VLVMSGGDDGALAANYIDLSIKSVVAHGSQPLAHAAQITGPISALIFTIIIMLLFTSILSSHFIKLYVHVLVSYVISNY